MNRPPVKIGRLRGEPSRAFATLSIEFLVGGGRRRGPVTAMRVSMKPGASHPPLRHAKTSEFFVVLAGSMRATIGGRRRALRRGDYAFLPPGTVHAFAAGERGVEVLSVFTPSLDMRKPGIVMSREEP